MKNKRGRESSWQFQFPTRLHFGRGGLRKLGELTRPLGAAAMLVGYHDRTGLEPTYDRAGKMLRDAGIEVVEFLDVPPDPDAQLAADGADMARERGVEVIVAVGGGSVIDAAKGIAVLAKLGGSVWDYTGANPNSQRVTDKLPLVAVPTTAGTGTEVSNVAVFTHPGRSRYEGQSLDGVDLKASIGGPGVPPEIALVDPDLTVGSPPALTAACGADALGHAIEARISRRANPMTSLLAGRAVAMIEQNLARAVENPDDPEPREPLAMAAMLAGAAFSEAGVVVTHALAQALGGVLHVPHGTAVALGTPVCLRYNVDQCVDPLSELAGACGMTSDSPEQAAEQLIERIVQLLHSVGLPDQIDVPQTAPDNLVDVLVQNAKQSTPVPIALNPRKVDEAALREMFETMLRFPGS